MPIIDVVGQSSNPAASMFVKCIVRAQQTAKVRVIHVALQRVRHAVVLAAIQRFNDSIAAGFVFVCAPLSMCTTMRFNGP